MLAIVLELNSIVQEKKKKVVVLCSRPRQNVKLGTFTVQFSCCLGSGKRTIGDFSSGQPLHVHDPFHGVVVQRRLKDVQKSVMHVQSCCSKPIAFLRFSLPSPWSLLKLPTAY